MAARAVGLHRRRGGHGAAGADVAALPCTPAPRPRSVRSSSRAGSGRRSPPPG
jgi:hypothetical protein